MVQIHFYKVSVRIHNFSLRHLDKWYTLAVVKESTLWTILTYLFWVRDRVALIGSESQLRWYNMMKWCFIQSLKSMYVCIDGSRTVCHGLRSIRARLMIIPLWKRSNFKWSLPLKLGFCFVLIWLQSCAITCLYSN